MIDAISWFGNQKLILIIIVVTLALLLARYNYRKQAVLLLSSLAALPLSLLLKGFFKTARPANFVQTNFMFNVDRYAFPSGHVLFYTAFFGFLIYSLVKTKRINLALRVLLILVGLVHISLVGFSRIVLDAHTLVDTVGGYVLGGLFLLSLIVMDKLWDRK
jgi:membrane-associated phospholipid phosphatase